MSYIFATARPGEGIGDWISCHIQMLEAFGGAPAIFVGDSFKASITDA